MIDAIPGSALSRAPITRRIEGTSETNRRTRNTRRARRTVNAPGRRLVIRGVGLTSYVQTVLVGGPCVTQYSLAFGHTAVSLATGESAFGKAPRRVPLGPLTQAVAAAQAVSTIIAQPGDSYVDFGDAPIYVNPGEFVALVAKHIGTVGTGGVIGHVVTFVYGWE